MNNYPILAAQNTWFAPTVSTVTKPNITEIEFKDSYNPDASVIVTDSWDASAAKDGSITCYVIGTKLIIAGNGSGKIAANEDSSEMFCGYAAEDRWGITKFISIDLLDTSNVTNMMAMFFNCRQLIDLDLSGWDTSKVTTMEYMFAACKSFINFDLSYLNVSSVTNFNYMFTANPILTTLNLSNWDLSGKSISMKQMFQDCTALTTIEGLDNWDTSNIIDVACMFIRCNNLITVDISNWNTSNITTIEGMFWGCSNLTNLDISNWNTFNIENMYDVFGGCLKLTTIGDLSNWDTSKVKFTGGMFSGCEQLATVGDLSNWDTTNLTNTKNMFAYCNKITSLGNISNWNTSNVTTMARMFNSCSKLTGIGDLANWDTSSCTDMSFMFWGASSIKEIDVSKWDVSKVTNFDHFAAHAGLRRKGIENWNTSSAVNMNAMFHNCPEEELDLSGFDTSKVQIFGQMFENSPNLKRIKGLENWDTSSGLGFEEMFGRCYKLEEVNLSSFDTSKAKNGIEGSTNGHLTATLNNMFYSCNSLKKVTLGSNFSINGDGTNTATANMLILPTPSTDYIEGADGLWYTFNGDSYAPNAMKDRTYNTYYASKNLIRDLTVRVNNGSLLDIVAAVRERVPDLAPTLLSDIDDVIRNIEHKEE